MTAVVDRLQSEMPGCVVLWGTGHIRLQPWAVPVAEELNQRFGDLVELRVGWLGYPPDHQPSRPPVIREVPEMLDADETLAELDGHAVVSSGHTLWHGLRLHNLGHRELLVATNRHVTADVVDPRTGDVVGGYAGLQQMPGVMFTAAPGRTTRIPLLIGTASSTLRLGYAVPSGHWGLQVTLTLDGWGSPGSPALTRRTPILPLTITSSNQTFQPRKPRHRQSRHRHPGQASA